MFASQSSKNSEKNIEEKSTKLRLFIKGVLTSVWVQISKLLDSF